MLHHFNPVSGLLAAALFLSAPVQAALPAYSAVKDEAKTVNKYMIVVWAGTDWSPKSREITRAVEHLAKNSPEPVLWCIQDEREEMTEEEQKLPKPPGKSGTSPPSRWSPPPETWYSCRKASPGKHCQPS